MKEVGGEAGEYDTVFRLQLILLLPVFLQRQIKRGCLRNFGGIFSEFRVPAVYVASGTAGADLCTAVPRVPHWHKSTYSQ